MRRACVLFVGGSLNQTTIVHAVARELQDEHDCFFSPCYADGLVGRLAGRGWLDFTVLGGAFRRQTMSYLAEQRLPLDVGGRARSYDLVVTATDLVVPRNVRRGKLVLVQEGMTDPENLAYHLVRGLRLPLYLASTAAAGLSDAYDAFCVASEGYREHFVRKGVRPEKVRVTGIPNFDDARANLRNDFPHAGYVLVATSDARETFKVDLRRRFLRRALAIAAGRPLLFKLHPNEDEERARREIGAVVPGAPVLAQGNTGHMVANCEVLITQYSSVAFLGLALGKEVHSYFDVDELRRLLPQQNGGTSGARIAEVCREMLGTARSVRADVAEHAHAC